MKADQSSAVMDQQRSHASVRSYTGEPIDVEMLHAILRSGQAAATSSFIQAYSVVRVTQPQNRSTIANAAGGQRWIEEAAEFLVFCADLRRIDGACRRSGAGSLEGYSEHGLAAIVDVALMAQNVLLAAESLGLGGVFIGGIRNDPVTVAKVLELPDLVAPVFGMCLGWPARKGEVKPRMPLDIVLHEGVYRDPSDEEMGGYDELMASYYRTRSTNVKVNDWTTATANAVQGKKRPHMLDFLKRSGFFRR